MSMNSFHARQGRKPTPSEAAATKTVVSKAPVDRHGLQRVDALLVSQGLAGSRTAAQRMIEAGRVRWSGGVISKPSQTLSAEVLLQVVADEADRYVSRGAFKLQGALSATGLNVAGKICLDVGQSTGGFTDCLLQAGAAQVVGVDVGHGQLHPRLQADPRVTALEGINARVLCAADLGSALPAKGFDLIVGDVSFISLTLVLPALPALLAPLGELLLLVKPQFEVGPGNLGKGGIVKNPVLYQGVEDKLRLAAQACGLRVAGWLDSPITGTDGNREFFIWIQR